MNEELQALRERWDIVEHFEMPECAEILVVGAYKGITMELLARMFPTFKRILGFEPQEWAIKEARGRFHKNQLEGLWLIGYALGDETRGVISECEMQEFGTDACSFHNSHSIRQPGKGLIAEAAQIFPLFYQEGQNIDLAIINIEGGEFELLPHLNRTNWLSRINRLAVQWHIDISPLFTEEEMDKQIVALEESGFTTKVDERPSWTLHVR